MVLAALVSRASEPLSTDALADALWGDRVPPSGAKVVQGCVVRLRKRLGTAAIESGPSGYRLVLSEDELDLRRFERLLERAQESADADPARAAHLAREALELWHGSALEDLVEWEPGRVEAERLEGLRMDAEELLVESEIGAGRARAVLDRARVLVAQAPFRERRWALLATALYQAGRQREALGAVTRARRMLVNELGLDPGRDLVDLEERLLRQDPALAPPVLTETSAVCPYRGLLPYGTEHADAFFGREDDETACLRRFRDTGVLAVVGPSGVGKSSLVRAGVVASLLRDATPVLVTTPGVHPMASLDGLKPRGRQVLVVDQAEEAVTVCPDAAERERYFAALATHVGAGGGLVLSLRADHLGAFASYADIARAIEVGMYLLGPMGEPDLRSAIEGPARRAGLRVEPGLVDLLVREVEGAPAALPMLSFVLRATWERREGPTLTVEGYRATGGIRHAVAQSAESLYDELEEHQRNRLRNLLLRLVIPTEDGDAVRARVPRAKVAADAGQARLVERLVEARLITVDGDSVQIAHEALVRVWPRLRGWLDDDVEGQRVFRHLAEAADAWDAMGRPDSELYRGARLTRALDWRDRADPDLNETEAAFIEASSALSESELRAAETRIAQQRQVNRRLRTALAGVGVLMALALVAGVVAVQAAERSRDERDRARSAADLADVRRAGAQALTSQDAATSLLLGVAALQMDRSPQARENLATTLTSLGALRRIHDVGGPLVSVTAGGAGDLVAASEPVGGLRLFRSSALVPVEIDNELPPPSAVTISHDGRLLARAVNQWTGGLPRLTRQPVRIYHLPSGKPVGRQPGGWPPSSAVEYALDFSRDGRRLVAGVNQYPDGNQAETAHVMVWDLADPDVPAFDVVVPELPQAALSPDGRLVYTATLGPRSVRVYDVESGRLVRWTGSRLITQPLKGAMDVSPDGSTLAIATGNRILRFEAETLRALPALLGHSAEIMDVEYSRDGALLLSTSTDRTTIVWDAASGRQVRTLAAHSGEVAGGAFGVDDRSIYSGSGDGTMMAWDLSGRDDFWKVGRATSPGRQQVGASVAAPDGRSVARFSDGRLWFVDNLTGRTTSRAPIGQHVFGTVWSPDSRWFVTSGDKGLSMWNATGGRLVEHLPEATWLRNAAFSVDADTLYLSDGTTLKTVARPSMAVTHSVRLPSDVVVLVPHPDGSVLLATADGTVMRFDPESGRVLARSASGMVAGQESSPVLSPDGSRLAAADRGNRARLLDVETLTWAGPPSPTGWGSGGTYSPDGHQIAAVEADRITLWDGRSGEHLASLPIADLPGLGLYATGSLAPGVSISYLPDSSGLLVAAADGRVWTVRTRLGAWTRRACEIAGRNLTREEWQEFFPRRAYQVTCPEWPAGG